MLKGKHLIGGQWLGDDNTFVNEPVNGPAMHFCSGSESFIDMAAQAAEAAVETYGYADRSTRARFLRQIANFLDEAAQSIIDIGVSETALPATRLNSECVRTTAQMRMFANLVEDGAYLDLRHDQALPDRKPVPRPDLRLMQRPVGPVAVFGASNFPLAFSVAGGDTASALAAGCPVVVKAHSAHPGLSETVSRAIHEAVRELDLHPGVFSMIHGGSHSVGASLVTHPLIKAVGFTGSLGGGRSLYDLCAARPEPIPFYGELGSLNPVFILDAALASRAHEIAVGWIQSLTLHAGQFCTNPSVVVLSADKAEPFLSAAVYQAANIPMQTTLTAAVAAAYEEGKARISAVKGVREFLASGTGPRAVSPALYVVDAGTFQSRHVLRQEVFGPLGLVIAVKTGAERLAIARELEGQLTCSLHAGPADFAEARRLLPVLERKAGRLIVNSFPTGVEVCDAMVHGGPYPASTNFGATSVGSLAIRRFLRPVCFQNFPNELLPDDLRVT